jgi:hypothetical protein
MSRCYTEELSTGQRAMREAANRAKKRGASLGDINSAAERVSGERALSQTPDTMADAVVRALDALMPNGSGNATARASTAKTVGDLDHAAIWNRFNSPKAPPES